MSKRVILVALALCSAGCGPTEGEQNVQTEVREPEYPPPRPRIVEPEPSPAEQSQFDEAYSLFHVGDNERALTDLNEFVRAHPNSPLADDAQLTIARTYGSMERYDDALAAFRAVGERYPASDSVPVSLGLMAHMAFYDMNDFPAARRYTEAYIAAATLDNVEGREGAIGRLRDWDVLTERYRKPPEQREREEREMEEAIRQHDPREQIKISRRRERGEHMDGEDSGPVRLRRISVFNGADISFQNVVIRVSYYTRSGTLIGQRAVTLDGTIDAGREVEYPEVHTGFDGPNAASTRIEVLSATQAR